MRYLNTLNLSNKILIVQVVSGLFSVFSLVVVISTSTSIIYRLTSGQILPLPRYLITNLVFSLLLITTMYTMFRLSKYTRSNTIDMENKK